jgi:prepilin peptidase CpaA
MTHLAATPIAVVVLVSLIAAVTDVWKFKVYNALTLPVFVLGMLYHAYVGGWAGFSHSALGAAFGFGALVLFHLMGGVGAGDVKLLAALGAWLGIELTFNIFIASALATGVYAIFLMLFRQGFADTCINLQIMLLRVTSLGRHLISDDRIEVEVTRDDRRKRLIPFAAMVAVGVFATLLWIKSAPPIR